MDKEKYLGRNVKDSAVKPIQCSELLKKLRSGEERGSISSVGRKFTDVFTSLEALQQSFLPELKKAGKYGDDEEKDRDEKEVKEKSEMETAEKDMYQSGCFLSAEDLQTTSIFDLSMKIATKIAATLDMDGLQLLLDERCRLSRVPLIAWSRVKWEPFLNKVSSLWNVDTYMEMDENKRDIVMARSLYLCVWLMAMLEEPRDIHEKFSSSMLFGSQVVIPCHIQVTLCLLWRHWTKNKGFLQAMLSAALHVGKRLLLEKIDWNDETADAPDRFLRRHQRQQVISHQKIKQQMYCVPASKELKSVLLFLQLVHSASIYCGWWKPGEDGSECLKAAILSKDDNDDNDTEFVYHFGKPTPLLQVLGVRDVRDCLEPVLDVEEFCEASLIEKLETLIHDAHNPMTRTSWWKPSLEKFNNLQQMTFESSGGGSSDQASSSATNSRQRSLFTFHDVEDPTDEFLNQMDKIDSDESLCVQLLDYPFLLSMELRVQFLQMRANLLRKSRRSQNNMPRHYLTAAAMLHSILTENEFAMESVLSPQRRALPRRHATGGNRIDSENIPRITTTTESSSSHTHDTAASSSSSAPMATSNSNIASDESTANPSSSHYTNAETPSQRFPFLNFLELGTQQTNRSSVESTEGSRGSTSRLQQLLNLQDSFSSADSASSNLLPRHRLLHLLSSYPFAHLHDSNVTESIEWESSSSEEDSDSSDEGPAALPFINIRVRTHRSSSSGGTGRDTQAHNLTIGNPNSRSNAATERYWNLIVERERITESFLTQLNALLESRNSQLLTRPLRIQFSGEPGMDQGGGLTKEFFHLIFSQMFQPEYGLFTWHEDSGVYWLTCYEEPLSEHLVEYKYVGILIALCVYHAIPINVSLPNVFFYKILGKYAARFHFNDVYLNLGRGLNAMLSHDDVEETPFEEIYCQTFEVTQQDTFGCIFHYELVPGGKTKSVTTDNMHEYVDIYADYLLNKSVERQFKQLQEGWNLVLNGKHYEHLLLPQEFRRILYDEDEETVCIESLKNHTVYSDVYHESHPNICAFWNVVLRCLTSKEHVQLLQFVTASRRLPLGGYRKLKFTIVPAGGEDDRLPSAHTCFNTLILPNYTCEEQLLKHLRMAIQHNEGFGLT